MSCESNWMSCTDGLLDCACRGAVSPREGPAGGDSCDCEGGKLMAFGTRRTAPASPVGQSPCKTLGILVEKG